MPINTRDLASLAALGVLGYGLMGRGKKSDVPVEDRKGVPVEQILRSADVQTIPTGDDQYDPNVKYGSIMELPEPGWESKKATTPSKASSTSRSSAPSMLSPEEAAAKNKPRRYNPSILTPAQGAANYKPRRTPEAVPPSKTEQAYKEAEERAASPEGRAERQKQIESQALGAVRPEEMLLGPGMGVKSAANLAKNLANRTSKPPYYSHPALAAPQARIAGPSKAELMARDRAARMAERDAAMARENYRRSGIDPDNINPELASNLWRMGMKKGGKVKVKKMASGGAVRSTASKRADGIAQKGRTKGKLY